MDIDIIHFLVIFLVVTYVAIGVVILFNTDKKYHHGIILAKVTEQTVAKVKYYFIVNYDDNKVKKVQVDRMTWDSFQEKDNFALFV